MNSKPVNYKEAVEYIESIPKFTQKHTQEHTREFLERLGRPAFDRKVVHVAGTNGKGSVCAYIQAILEAEGKKTGFFTSPHLISINERIQIGREPIDNEKFYQVFEHVYDVVKKMEEEGIPHPSYFEFLFGMGLSAFEKSDVEYIVLETGLGGRLDATNAFPCPALTVITSISLDHTMILGNTIEQIAAEKAGIIKEGTPVIFDGNDEAAAEIIQNTAKEHHAPCREIGKNAFEIREVTRKHIAFSRTNAYHKDVIWQVPICGIYQVKNAEIAIEAAQCLLGNKPEHEEMWRDAVAKIQWQGRMEECADHFIIDGAHNPGAIEAFAESVNTQRGNNFEKIILFSAVKEKEYETMIHMLCESVDAKQYILTQIQNERGVSTKELADVFQKYTDKKIIEEENLEKAFYMALEEKGEHGRVYCLGSLYLIGMLKELIAGGKKHA